jgi:hypothetical protein
MTQYQFVFNPLSGKFDIVNVASGGTPTIPEVYQDPSSPTPQQTWILATTNYTAGQAMGIMGLTYSGDLASDTYQLSYRTNEGTTVRTPLN